MKSTEPDLSEMLGDFLRQRTNSAKDLARRVGCDPRTAEGFRAGRHWPQAKHWMRLVATFGTDVTEAVFHPDRAAARLTEEIAALEAKLAEQRAALRVVAEGDRSFAPSRAKAGARHEDRTPEVATSDGVRR